MLFMYKMVQLSWNWLTKKMWNRTVLDVFSLRKAWDKVKGKIGKGEVLQGKIFHNWDLKNSLHKYNKWDHRYLIEEDCSSGQFKSAKLKDKNHTTDTPIFLTTLHKRNTLMHQIFNICWQMVSYADAVSPFIRYLWMRLAPNISCYISKVKIDSKVLYKVLTWKQPNWGLN